MKSSFVALFALVISVVFTVPSFAGDEPMIEINASVDSRFDSPYTTGNDWAVIPSYSATVGGKFNYWKIDAEAELTAQEGDGLNFEFRGSAGLLFLKLHEIYVRTGGAQGEEKRAMLGLGGSVDLPASLGKLTASVGAMGILWQRPKGAAGASGVEQQMLGLYAGATLFMHIWRFENELRVAYYASPRIDLSLGSMSSGTQDISGVWSKNGLIASDRLYFRAIKLPFMSFGPDLRAAVEQLPDGTEWVVTAGIGGTFGSSG
ncbi:hypothetical protein WDW86_00680, partial [Bdellovibrionota bacterium FG-2]